MGGLDFTRIFLLEKSSQNSSGGREGGMIGGNEVDIHWIEYCRAYTIFWSSIPYFGVVYHVYSVCIVQSCWLLGFERSVHVSDGFPKTALSNFFLGFFEFV